MFIANSMYIPHSSHRVATAAFWRTFHHDGKISPGWWRWGVHAHPLSLYLPSRTATKYPPAERADTLPVFHLYPICSQWYINNTYIQRLKYILPRYMRIRSSRVWIRSSRLWTRSSLLIRASDCHCQSRNSPFSILASSDIVESEGCQMKPCLEKYTKQVPKNPPV